MGVTGKMVRPTAVIDAPFAYGTLSLQTHEEGSSDDDLDIVAEFARVVALGYARYLDFTSLEDQNRTIQEANKTLEDQNRQIQEASQLKSRFLANMSHELRTPLNAVIGYSEMLAEDATESGFEQAVPDLGRIEQAGRHLLTLVNDLLDISKIESGKMGLHIETFDLARAVEETLSTVTPQAERNRNTLDLDHDDGIRSMRSDATKVRQILLNLLSNATKFTQDGKVSLRVEPDPDHAGMIVFTVTDTGIGISDKYLEKLFDPFSQADASTTREHGGTGLGLTITRHFCHMLNGNISVQSEPNKGSTFKVVLPDGLPNHQDDPLSQTS
jgi:signal transduction histidine kinase